MTLRISNAMLSSTERIVSSGNPRALEQLASPFRLGHKHRKAVDVRNLVLLRLQQDVGSGWVVYHVEHRMEAVAIAFARFPAMVNGSMSTSDSGQFGYMPTGVAFTMISAS